MTETEMKTVDKPALAICNFQLTFNGDCEKCPMHIFDEKHPENEDSACYDEEFFSTEYQKEIFMELFQQDKEG